MLIRKSINPKWPNKSLQATGDGVSSSAVADYVIRPALPELWTLGSLRNVFL
jgi:hypothetical protein